MTTAVRPRQPAVEHVRNALFAAKCERVTQAYATTDTPCIGTLQAIGELLELAIGELERNRETVAEVIRVLEGEQYDPAVPAGVLDAVTRLRTLHDTLSGRVHG